MESRIWKTTLSLVLFLVLAIPVTAQDWAGRGRASGRVLDPDNNPVAGAKVTLSLPGRPDAGPKPLTTDKKGRWSYLGLAGGSWHVTIEAEGYKISEGNFNVDEFQVTKPLVINLTPNPYAAITEGQGLIDQGKYDEARAKFEKVLPEMPPPQQAQIHALIGSTYYEQRQYPAAVQEYEKALPDLSDKDAVSVRLRLGDAYLQQKQYDKARSTYEATLSTLGAEGREQVLIAIARSYDMQDRRDDAVKTLQRILEKDPQNVRALQLIADLLSRSGKEEEAQKYLDQIPDTEELPADMLLNQGIRFYNQQKLDQALSNFQRVIKQDPSNGDAYYYRGLVYLAQSKNAEAKTDFEKLLQLEPDSQYASDAKQFLDYLDKQ